MTQPRSKIVNPDVTRWYHCISRCVRRAFLIAEYQDFDRKAWLDQRLRELDSLFAISVAGFSVMDNHLHLLVRIDPEVADSWTPIQVAHRWLKLYPPRVHRKPVTAVSCPCRERCSGKSLRSWACGSSRTRRSLPKARQPLPHVRGNIRLQRRCAKSRRKLVRRQPQTTSKVLCGAGCCPSISDSLLHKLPMQCLQFLTDQNAMHVLVFLLSCFRHRVTLHFDPEE